MATIQAGASTTVTVPEGSELVLKGSGIAVLGPGRQANVQIGVNGAGTLGPYQQNQIVYLSATTPLSYEITSADDSANDTAIQLSASNRLPGVSVLLIGDSRTAQNYVLHYITSISRTAGVVTAKFSGGAMDSPFPWAWKGCPVQVENVPEDVRGKRILTGGSGTTWTFDAPGPDFAEYTPAGNPHVMNLAHYASNGWFTRMNARAMQKFDLLDVVASVGRDTAEMVARLPEARASQAQVVFIWGGINGIIGGKSWDQILPDLKTIALDMLAEGKRVYLMTEAPLYGSNNTAPRAIQIARLSQEIRKLCRETPGLNVVDVYRQLVNPTAASYGEAKQYMLSTDNLHESSRGADEIAKAALAATADIPFTDTRVSSNADTYGFNALNTNMLDSAPFAAGAADTPYAGSQVGAGYAGVKEGAVSPVFSVVDRADGMGKNNRMTYTPTAVGDGGRWHSPNVNGARVKNNMRVFSETTVKTTGFVGGNGRAIRHYLNITLANSAGAAAVSALAEVDSGLYLPQEDIEMVLRTPTVPIAVAPQNMYVVTGLASSAAGSAISLDMGLSKVDVQ